MAAADFDADGAVDIALLFEDSRAPERHSTMIGEGEGGIRVFLGADQGFFRESDHVHFGLAYRADHLASLDYDHDGNIDLTLGSLFFRGRGDGTFESTRSVSLHREIRALAAGDFTGDGRDDLATVGSREEIVIFENLGESIFRPGQSFSGFQGSPSLTAAELNGDGVTDLVVITETAAGHRPVLLLSQDDGTLGPVEWAPPGGFQGAVALADFDGDGATDIAVGCTDESGMQVHILRNEGPGSFVPLTSFFAPDSFFDMAAGDFDGDGRADIGLHDGHWRYQGRITVLRQVDALVFEALPPFTAARSIRSRPPFLAMDLDRDGRTDLVSTAMEASLDVLPPHTISVYRGLSNGSFLPEKYDVPLLLGGRSDHVFLAAGDLDGDGWPDVAAGELERPSVFILPGTPPGAPASLDLDLNGQPDECQSPMDFIRGDSDADGDVDLTDALFLLRALFRSGAQPSCAKSADADDDGGLQLDDAVLILAHLFQGAGGLAAPYPFCGPDPSWDELSCKEFMPCEP
jgi:hypothetical protein